MDVNKKFLIYFLVCSFFIFLNCETIPNPYKDFFERVVPTNFPETSGVWVFEYLGCGKDYPIKGFFDDFLLIGASMFKGTYHHPYDDKVIWFAKKLGADFVVVEIQNPSKKVYPYFSIQKSESLGVDPFGNLYTTSYMTATPKAYTYYIFEHIAYFYKNVKNIKVLWESKMSDFPLSGSSKFDGLWKNGKWLLYVYSSKDNVVGTLAKKIEDVSWWNIDDVKFIFDKNSQKGLYLLYYKTPMRASFRIDKFGYLVVIMKDSNNEPIDFITFEQIK